MNSERSELSTEALARSLLAEVEAEVQSLTTAANRAEWDASTTGTEAARDEAARREFALRSFLSDRDRYARIRSLLDAPDLGDPSLRRRLELLALDHLPNQLPEATIADLVRRGKEIEAEFYSFRAHLDGRPVTNNDIISILRGERDPDRRRAAWEASKQIGPRVADRLIELVRRRNEAARALGYRDYYALQLHLQEIDEHDLLGLFDELKTVTDQPFQRAKDEVDRRIAHRFGIAPDALRAWHYEDPFFQEPPLSDELGLEPFFLKADLVGIAERFFAGLGLPIGDVLERSDLEERPGKDQHAYCAHIDREGDVRILCNLKSNDRWMGILLHELGHAAYDKFIPRDLPWILRQPPHTATTEAIAMFMDRLPYDLDWVVAASGRRPEDSEALAGRLSKALRFEMLLTARWVPVMTLFERALYANPGSDGLNRLWWDLVEEYQRVPRPEDRNEPDWAAKIHLTVAPVYYHNYLLGELMASQLKAALDQQLDGAAGRGYMDCTELGEFLRARVFAPGAALQWQEHLRQATGSPLGVAAFVDHFVGSGA